MKGTTVTIDGRPRMILEFFDLITWNKFSTSHPKSRWGIAKKARELGRSLAQDFLNEVFWEPDWDSLHFVNRVLLVIKVYPPREEISDIHNVAIKNTIDGFRDASVWVDDEWAYVPLVVFMWAGIDDNVQYKRKRAYKGKVRRAAPMRRTIIEVHELDALIINQGRLLLPKGRERFVNQSVITY